MGTGRLSLLACYAKGYSACLRNNNKCRGCMTKCCDNLGQVIVDTPGCQKNSTTAVSYTQNIFHNCFHRKLLKQQSVGTLPEMIGLFWGEMSPVLWWSEGQSTVLFNQERYINKSPSTFISRTRTRGLQWRAMKSSELTMTLEHPCLESKKKTLLCSQPYQWQ